MILLLTWLCVGSALLSMGLFFIAGALGLPSARKFYIGGWMFVVVGLALGAIQ